MTLRIPHAWRLLVLALAWSHAQAAEPPAPAPLVPADTDAYADFVRRAEAGATDIDYRAMRLAWVESAAFLRVKREAVDDLRGTMHAATAPGGDPARVRDAALAILRIVYVDLDAQKALRQACHLLGDEACATKYHDIELGLLKSIIATGDGKACATAWEVVSIDEEYFILGMVGFELRAQAGPGKDGFCDTMTGTDENGEPRTYYFDVRPVFRGYERQFQP
jgi:hypothetical protein